MSNPNVQHPFLQLFRSSRFAHMTAQHFVVMSVLLLAMLSAIGGLTLLRASAHTTCANGDKAYSIVSGDTLSTIALNNNTTTENLASHNGVANANTIYAGQQLCIPVAQNQAQTVGITHSQALPPTTSAVVDNAKGDPYPYGQCTWWASQRYFQLHKVYVPWTSNADAWEWTARASQFHWKVSTTPTVGAIIDLQPWVQGAYGLGHVAIVEKVFADGHVIASNMNWGGSGSNVAYINFVAGRGTTFITQQ